MKWLQLSDLHIKECTDWQLMKKSYKKILETQNIDFAIVTGDLHNITDDYEDTKSFLDLILSAANIDKNSLYIIPGNHDAKNFKDKELNVEYILNHMEKDSECYQNYQSNLKKSFEDYEVFYKEYFEIDDYRVKDVEPHIWNNKINIIALNTALISDGKEHEQLVNTLELSKIEKENSIPTIVIGHHEMSYFFEEQQLQLKRIFTDLNVSAYLCGDLHKESTKNISTWENNQKNIASIVCGKSAIDNKDTYSHNTFIIYECADEQLGEVKVHLYKWNSDKKAFRESADFDYDDGKYKFTLHSAPAKERAGIKKTSYPDEKKYDDILKLKGYVLIGPRGKNGIKYIWEKNEKIVESLAFNERINSNEITEVDKKTSAYTASVSQGCILAVDNTQCAFCETGNRRFSGYLTAEDIALQNIFMAEYDSDCPSYPGVRNNLREFAYMGQGEPGYAYHLIRKSILLTDYAMQKIEQKIARYIISTCGINGFIPLLINDIKSGIYKNRISLHFSLNAIGNNRDILMPINRDNCYKEFLKECELLYNLTNEKIAVSLIVFNDLSIKRNENKFSYTLNRDTVKDILNVLNPEIFRIDLRDFNSNILCRQENVSNEYATNLLNEVKNSGYEAKLFSCFGESEYAACGMLSSRVEGISVPGKTTIQHYKQALELLKEAKENI